MRCIVKNAFFDLEADGLRRAIGETLEVGQARFEELKAKDLVRHLKASELEEKPTSSPVEADGEPPQEGAVDAEIEEDEAGLAPGEADETAKKSKGKKGR